MAQRFFYLIKFGLVIKKQRKNTRYFKQLMPLSDGLRVLYYKGTQLMIKIFLPKVSKYYWENTIGRYQPVQFHSFFASLRLCAKRELSSGILYLSIFHFQYPVCNVKIFVVMGCRDNGLPLFFQIHE